MSLEQKLLTYAVGIFLVTFFSLSVFSRKAKNQMQSLDPNSISERDKVQQFNNKRLPLLIFIGVSVGIMVSIWVVSDSVEMWSLPELWEWLVNA